ncbi:presqualene diphosphate synthase HpnD [Rosettibacter firmus]|uniref:presqualene diphosphate synthase HpnD n=1 Tax=Rosettibacter firmus TaxID=3111522 RepID=UPI00336C0D81
MQDQSKIITKESKSSFYYAFSLLPREKREAMNTVYAFCRKTDDIVDESNEDENIKYEQLRKWRNELEKALHGQSEFFLLNKLAKIIRQFNIPLEPFFELISGVEMDLQKKSYISFDDLIHYCYRVASTVGLMCIEIFGYKNNSAKDYAVNLGIAMQLTNILRDVGKDVDKGRIYLPQKDLIKFNYTEKELIQKKYNSNFKQLMEFESERALYYFQKAEQFIDYEDKPLLFPARAMQHIYLKLLKKIKNKEYDVLNNQIRVNTFEKAAISLGVWAKYSLIY